MKDWFQKLWQKIVRPSKGVTAVIWSVAVLSCTGAILLAILSPKGLGWEILSYVSYGLAGLSLAHAVYTLFFYAGNIKEKLLSLIGKNAFLKKLTGQYGFRTFFFALFSLALNVAYVVFHIVLALTTDSFWWYLSLASYYGLLVALRSGIVLYQRKKRKTEEEDEQEQKKTELAKYRTCGILLTILPVCLTIPLLQIFYLDKSFEKDSIAVIAFAAYAFYKITMAILGALKARKHQDLTLRAVRNISLADGMVSIFSLQTALLFSYGTGGGYAAANAATGSVVCLLTMSLGVYMIINSIKIKREIKKK